MHTIDTPHGPMSYKEGQVLEMDGGLVGFAEARRYVLIENEDLDPLRWLVAVDHPDLSFLVVDPRRLVPAFEIQLSDDDRARLRVDNEEELLPLAIAVVGEKPEAATANLKAPILVNSREMLAAQVILTDSDYSVQHTLLPTGDA